MKNIKNSSRLVHQLERIRMGGRDLSEDLSEESRRKFVTELMNSKHDANNLLLDIYLFIYLFMKKEIELFICKDIDAEEKNELEIVIEDIILLREVLGLGEQVFRKLLNFSSDRYVRVIFCLFSVILKRK